VLRDMVIENGAKNWSTIASALPGRIGKQCRERWHNHLDPNIRKEKWSQQEDGLILKLHSKFGNRWCEIAKALPGRTDNAIKNRFNSKLKKYVSEGPFTEALRCEDDSDQDYNDKDNSLGHESDAKSPSASILTEDV